MRRLWSLVSPTFIFSIRTLVLTILHDTFESRRTDIVFTEGEVCCQKSDAFALIRSYFYEKGAGEKIYTNRDNSSEHDKAFHRTPASTRFICSYCETVIRIETKISYM